MCNTYAAPFVSDGNSLLNKYQYNGIELNTDFGLLVNEARFRTLDAQLGRWWQIDPEVEQFEAWSPYNSNLDNPIRYDDPKGDNPLIGAMAAGFIVGFVVDVGFQVGAQIHEGGWKNVNFGEVDYLNATISGVSGSMVVLGGASVGTLGASKGGQFALGLLNNAGVGTIESVTKQIVSTGTVDGGKTVSDAVVSTVTGGHGDGANHFLGEVATKTEQKVVSKVIDTSSEVSENTLQGISDASRSQNKSQTQNNPQKTTAPKQQQSAPTRAKFLTQPAQPVY